MVYNYVCRLCEHEWEAEHSIHEKLEACPLCESADIYRAVGSGGFQLKGGNWAYDGYSQEPGTKSVNLGAPSPSEKRAAKKVISDRIEAARYGVSVEK
jgi:putative FmdB family regulatory protein